MVDTGSVSDYDGRTMISFSLCYSLEQLSLIGAHSYLSHIYIAIAHSHHAQILLASLFARSSELSYRACRSSFGGLTAGI